MRRNNDGRATVSQVAYRYINIDTDVPGYYGYNIPVVYRYFVKGGAIVLNVDFIRVWDITNTKKKIVVKTVIDI